MTIRTIYKKKNHIDCIFIFQWSVSLNSNHQHHYWAFNTRIAVLEIELFCIKIDTGHAIDTYTIVCEFNLKGTTLPMAV